MNIRTPESFGEPFATAFAEQAEKINPLSEIFGDCDFVYIVGYSIYSPGAGQHLQCQDIFPGKLNAGGVDQAFLDAYGTYVDQDDPHRPNSSYRGCIRLDRNGTYARVKLFSGE